MSLTKRNSPSALRMRAIAATVASCTKRRFQCRRFGQGSGWIRSIRAQRLRRRPGQQFGGVAGEQADVADIVRFDLRQDLRHAVDIGLAADEAGLRKGARFGDQMLAAAEADLEPDIVEPARSNSLGEIAGGAGSRCRAQDAAAGVRSDRPGASGACGPCGGRRTSLACMGRAAIVRRDRRRGDRGWRPLIAASGTADAAAAPAARSTRYTSARNGYARPCRRRRGRRASRYAAR